MQQGTSAPAVNVSRTFGRYTIYVNTTVDGAYSVSVFSTRAPHRHDALSFITWRVEVARLAWRAVGNGGIYERRPEQVLGDLRNLLLEKLTALSARQDPDSRELAAEIDRVLDLFPDSALDRELAEITSGRRGRSA